MSRVYFQQKPNIYENAKAFLGFTPGKLQQCLQNTILMWMAGWLAAGGSLAGKQKSKPKTKLAAASVAEAEAAAATAVSEGEPKNRAWIAV